MRGAVPPSCRSLSSALQVIARLEQALAHHRVEGHADALPAAALEVLRQLVGGDGPTVPIGDQRRAAALVEPHPATPLEVRARQWGATAEQARLPANLKPESGCVGGVQDVLEVESDDLAGGQPGVEQEPRELLLAHAERFAMEQCAELADVVAVGLAREHLVELLAGRDARCNFVGIHVVFEGHMHLTDARHAEGRFACVHGHQVGKIRRAPEGGQPQHDLDSAAVDADAVHEPELDERLVELRIADRAEGRQHGLLGDGTGTGRLDFDHAVTATWKPALDGTGRSYSLAAFNPRIFFLSSSVSVTARLSRMSWGNSNAMNLSMIHFGLQRA